MPDSYDRILVHIIFSTKRRQKLIHSEFRDDLEAYVGGIIRQRGCTPVAVGMVEDHGHMGIFVHRDVAVSSLVRDIKSRSTRWLRDKKGQRGFGWQKGYAAFSVSRTHAEQLVHYIRDQDARHAGSSFELELENIFERHGIAFVRTHALD
jgi:REP element-mobilizing transposase RayT